MSRDVELKDLVLGQIVFCDTLNYVITSLILYQIGENAKNYAEDLIASIA